MTAFISNPALKSILRGVVVWAPMWIGTTAIFGLIGVIYAFVLKEDTYLSSQALLVRDEANGAVMRLGRFQSQAEMKAAQETILEMAKSHQVVHDALAVVGKTPSWLNWMDFGASYPSKETVEQTAKSAIQVHAPKGTEFGVTEVIYLDIKESSAERAQQLNKALCDSLEARLQQVRKARADGVIQELSHASESARKALIECTEELNNIERQAGSDLTDLRGMTDNVSGATSSRIELDQIRNEIRQLEAMRQTLVSDREFLMGATDDPSGLMVAPNSILNSYPSLKRITDGLVDSQIASANLLGKYTSVHPSSIASRSSQSSIADRLHRELKSSIAGIDADIALADKKIQRLDGQKRLAEERLGKLAGGRASYANLVAEVKSRATILDASEKALAEAQAISDSSISTSLLTRLDAPMVSDRPIGPGRTTLAGLCAVAGLLTGLGIVFVITPIDVGPSYGRRAVDRATGRRSADTIASENGREAKQELKAIDMTTNSRKEDEQPLPISTPAVSDLLVHERLTEEWKTLAKQNAFEKPEGNGNLPRRSKMNLKLEMEDVSEISDSIVQTSAETLLPKKSLPLTKVKSESNEEIDQAFREIARLKGAKPETRSEEISVQMKIHELRSVLATMGHQADTETLNREGWLKPRPSVSH